MKVFKMSSLKKAEEFKGILDSIGVESRIKVNHHPSANPLNRISIYIN